MGIAACKGMGIKMIGIGAVDFLNKVPHLILTFIWQVLRILTTQSINLKECPEIWRLAEGDETI